MLGFIYYTMAIWGQFKLTGNNNVKCDKMYFRGDKNPINNRDLAYFLSGFAYRLFGTFFVADAAKFSLILLTYY